MSDKVVVRFLRSWRGYSTNELAGFDSAVADALIEGGFAERDAGKALKAAAPKGAGRAGKAASAKPSADQSGAGEGAGPAGEGENPETGTGEGEGGEGAETGPGTSGGEGDDEEAKP